MTTEPSVSKNGWLLPSSQPVYPLAVPSQRTGYLTCNGCLGSLPADKAEGRSHVTRKPRPHRVSRRVGYVGGNPVTLSDILYPKETRALGSRWCHKALRSTSGALTIRN